MILTLTLTPLFDVLVGYFRASGFYQLFDTLEPVEKIRILVGLNIDRDSYDSEEEKLAIIQNEFERLYDPNHPVRFAIETLDSVEEVRIIKEALK